MEIDVDIFKSLQSEAPCYSVPNSTLPLTEQRSSS